MNLRLNAGVLLVVCTVASAHAQSAKSAVAEQKPALTVSAIVVGTSNLKQTIAANGSVYAWQEASISAQVSGLRLESISAQVGDRVKKGQVLAKFEQDTLNAEIAASRAQVAEASAASDEAKANAQRAKELAAQGFYSPQAQMQTAAQEKAATARLEVAQANLALQKLRQTHSVLRAPDDGVVTVRNATIGSVAMAGAELFRMNRQNRLEWRAELVSAELPKIRVGGNVQLEGGKALAVVRQVAPNLDAQTRNAIVFVDIVKQTKGDALKVGQFARGEFEGANKTVLTAPVGSVVQRDGFAYVFVLKDNKVVQTKITTGQRSGTAIEIVSGLNEGARIVGQGAAFLTDGDTVKVVQP